PGESLSKHRGRRSEEGEESDRQPQGGVSEDARLNGGADAIEEEEFVEVMTEPASEQAVESTPEGLRPEPAEDHLVEEEPAEEDQLEETTETAPEAATLAEPEQEPIAETPAAQEH